MSLDFPDRKKWLAIRNTPPNLWRMLGHYIARDETYCVGRNAGKRQLGKGKRRRIYRKSLQRWKRATGARQVRPHRSGGGVRVG